MVVSVSLFLSDIMSVDSKNHSFSLELKDSGAITHLQMTRNQEEIFLLEGYLGDIVAIVILEDVVLEIQGSLGVLRMDIETSKLTELIRHGK